MTKIELRQIFKRAAAMLSDQDKQMQSKSILDKLKGVAQLKEAKNVLVYAPTKSEPILNEFVKILRQQNKIVFYPKIINNQIVAIKTDENTVFLKSKYNILEPEQSIQATEKIDVAIIPAVAFSRQGIRLGHGGGYYDKYLALNPNIYKIGVCFCEQIAHCLPRESYDILMDKIITGETKNI